MLAGGPALAPGLKTRRRRDNTSDEGGAHSQTILLAAGHHVASGVPRAHSAP
jgi:hypothetical protein